MPGYKNKDADQTERMRKLISIFVVHSLAWYLEMPYPNFQDSS